MRKRIKRFLNKAPGTRFIYLHKLFHRSQKKLMSRLSRYSIGIILICIGIVLLVLPGPGILMILIGLGLIGMDSKRFATLLDKWDIKYHVWLRKQKKKSA